MNVNKIQRELGDDGILAVYRLPFHQGTIQNYPLLINTLPLIRAGTAHPNELSMVSEAILRHLGELNEAKSRQHRRLFNPLIWLQIGVRTTVTFPIRLAYWCGLFEYGVFEALSNNLIVRFLTFIVVVIGLLSSAVTILLGWDQFITIIGLK